MESVVTRFLSHFVKLRFLIVLALNGLTSINQASDFSNQHRTIQFDITPVLNARMVTTFTDNALIPWSTGVDGPWSGLATRSAADAMGSNTKIALPDNGIFEANSVHPYVKINFNNTKALGNQVRFSDKNATDSYSFAIAENHYACLSLFFMSALGTSELSIEITYSDNTKQVHNVTIEDWATKIPDNYNKYVLCTNLAKWSNSNQELEPDNHYLMGVNLVPDRTKKAVKITLNKPASETTLSFWGATGYGASSKTWTVPANSPEISYEGRTLVSQTGSVIQGYPAIVTRISFSGTALDMKVKTASDELYVDVMIDGNSPAFMKIPKGENSISLAKGLQAGEHQIAIYKRIESSVGIFEVISLTVTGHFLRYKDLPARKLLFMGDSFTAGQATTVEDGGPMHPEKAMRQNARLSYARILADKLNAQCHIVAYAGRGIIRDWQGIYNVTCAPEYYENTLPDDNLTPWDHASYQPDAIGVCLGNNDFGVGVPEQISYVKAYVEFVRKLRRDAPKAHIFLITSPTLTNELGKVPYQMVQKAYLDEVVQNMNDPKVHLIQIAQYSIVPDDGHPSGTAHRAIASELESTFKQVLNW